LVISINLSRKSCKTERMNNENRSIKTWSEDDRPREKFVQKGRHSLSDSELMAILIGSGSKNESAVELSRRILLSVENDLNKLGKLQMKELTGFKGMGEAKSITLLAALELGRRRKESDKSARIKVTSSKEAYQALEPHLSDLHHEEFFMLLLNRANEILKVQNISKGGVTGTVVDSKIIFRLALETPGCTGIILSHNHPSGSILPSDADKQITRKLVEAGKILEVYVHDHIIVGDKQYFSFADEGLM
jgi:DNA repair protein RadC